MCICKNLLRCQKANWDGKSYFTSKWTPLKSDYNFIFSLSISLSHGSSFSWPHNSIILVASFKVFCVTWQRKRREKEILKKASSQESEKEKLRKIKRIKRSRCLWFEAKVLFIAQKKSNRIDERTKINLYFDIIYYGQWSQGDREGERFDLFGVFGSWTRLYVMLNCLS